MIKIFERAFSIRWSKISLPNYRKEKVAYKKSITEIRKKMLADFNKMQQETENRWIQNYTNEQEQKWVRDMDKWRTSVCNIAMTTQKRIDYMKEKDIKLAERGKLNLMKMSQESFERRLMLDAMEIEKEQWFNHKNTDKILEGLVMPSAIIDHNEYTKKMEKVKY